MEEEGQINIYYYHHRRPTIITSSELTILNYYTSYLLLLIIIVVSVYIIKIDNIFSISKIHTNIIPTIVLSIHLCYLYCIFCYFSIHLLQSRLLVLQ